MLLLKKSFEKLLGCSKLKFQSQHPKFAFTMFPSIKDYRTVMPMDKIPKVNDELKFHHENEDVTGGIQNVFFIFQPFIFLKSIAL